MVRILIIDDHPIVCEGIKKIIERSPEFAVTARASTGGEALDLCRKNRFEMILLDISLPDINGLDVLDEIKRIDPHGHVIMFSIHGQEEYVLSSLQRGASGYISKDCPPEELEEAIRRVSQGEKYISPALMAKLARYFTSGKHSSSEECLSPREREVMHLIADGKRTGEIAKKLSLNMKTVSTYRARLLTKLGLKSNSDIVEYVIKQRLSGLDGI